MDAHDESSSQEGGPEIPKGVLRASKRGWDGEELEIRHGTEERPKDGFAAVDLEQFRNTEVGKGYQARGVVRQRTSGKDVAVHDMTGDTRKDVTVCDAKRKESKRQKIEKYMHCEGIREFRKEIELLLSSSTRQRK